MDGKRTSKKMRKMRKGRRRKGEDGGDLILPSTDPFLLTLPPPCSYGHIFVMAVTIHCIVLCLCQYIMLSCIQPNLGHYVFSLF